MAQGDLPLAVASLIFLWHGEHSLSGPLPPQQACHRQLGSLFDSKDTLSEGFNRFADFEPVENNPGSSVHFLFFSPLLQEPRQRQRECKQRDGALTTLAKNQAVSAAFRGSSTLLHTC